MLQRNIFVTGEYVSRFTPDDKNNPFQALYAAKRTDILASLKSSLPPGSSVLDLGGGMGRMAVPLAQDYQVTLCDISRNMLSLAELAASQSQVPTGHFSTCCLSAAEPLPFASVSFDRALSIDLLVHLPDPVGTLRELHRVLAPNGELLVDMTNSAPWWTLKYPQYVGRRPSRWLRTWRGGGVLPDWQDIVRHYSHAEFHRMLNQAGFAVIDEWSYGPQWCPKWFLARCKCESTNAGPDLDATRR